MRIPRWASAIVLGVGVLVVAIPGMLVYMRLTAKKLHPVPEEIPSIAKAPPPAPLAGPVERARAFLRTSLAEQNLPGVSVAVGIGGEIVWAEGFGFANVEESVPVTPDHRFRIGTASIALTSAGVGLLLEEGRLKLDDEIQTYVPEFGGKPWAPTIRQVMGHLGGVMGEDPDNGVLTSSRCASTSDALERFVKAEITQPGAASRFSTFGWILLSAAAERVSNRPFTAFLEENVLLPLGMRDTVKDSAQGSVPNEAPLYFPRVLSRPTFGVELFHKFDYSCYAGSGGYLSTPSDLVRFGMAITGGKLLRSETVRLLQTPQKLGSGEDTGYGLGWEISTIVLDGRPVRAAGHAGYIFSRMAASLLTVPERGIVVAVTTNIPSLAGAVPLAEAIAREFAAAR